MVRQRRAGSTLLETLLALAILSFVLMVLVTYMTRLNGQVDGGTMPSPQQVLSQAEASGVEADALDGGWSYRLERRPFEKGEEVQGLVLSRLVLEKNGQAYVFVTLKKEASDG